MFLYLTISGLIAIVDYKFNFFTQFRKSVNNIFSLFYIGLDKIFQEKEYVKNMYLSRKKLVFENFSLKEKIFLRESESILLSKYKLENQILHNLLNSSSDVFQKKMVARAIINEKNLYNECSIIIDKGKHHGVHIGQSVINQKGIVGQVSSVSNFTSRVSLIYNTSCTLSVRVLRNNIHMLVIGEGFPTFKLYSECLVLNADVRKGDVLVSTGLDNCFPKDYPVSIVTHVENNFKCGYSKIRSEPIMNFCQLNYLLLLWKKEINENQ